MGRLMKRFRSWEIIEAMEQANTPSHAYSEILVVMVQLNVEMRRRGNEQKQRCQKRVELKFSRNRRHLGEEWQHFCVCSTLWSIEWLYLGRLLSSGHP